MPNTSIIPYYPIHLVCQLFSGRRADRNYWTANVDLNRHAEYCSGSPPILRAGRCKVGLGKEGYSPTFYGSSNIQNELNIK